MDLSVNISKAWVLAQGLGLGFRLGAQAHGLGSRACLEGFLCTFLSFDRFFVLEVRVRARVRERVCAHCVAFVLSVRNFFFARTHRAPRGSRGCQCVHVV